MVKWCFRRRALISQNYISQNKMSPKSHAPNVPVSWSHWEVTSFRSEATALGNIVCFLRKLLARRTLFQRCLWLKKTEKYSRHMSWMIYAVASFDGRISPPSWFGRPDALWAAVGSKSQRKWQWKCARVWMFVMLGDFSTSFTHLCCVLGKALSCVLGDNVGVFFCVCFRLPFRSRGRLL